VGAGSSDASNAITVDKTPAALWVMALSVRVFGLSSWSILLPQAIGGFNGTDAYPTLAQFEAYVKAGRIHYFIGSQAMGGSSGSGDAQKIARWVAQHYTATTAGGVTVYDQTS
jgi:hypothetical protein